MLSSQDLVLKPSKSSIRVWCLPIGSKPFLKVEDKNGRISADRLFKIACTTLNLRTESTRFFGLFKGIAFPTKKYGEHEFLRLPCKTVTSIQKWSFDVLLEKRFIKGDPTAFQLLAYQSMSDILNGWLVPSEDQEIELKATLDEEFPSYKNYVDIVQKVAGYSSYAFKNTIVNSDVRLVKDTIKKGWKVDIFCDKKSLVVISPGFDLSIPWRKIRRMTDLKDQNCVGFEIYVSEKKTFVWLEVQTIQACLLLQVTGEILTCFQKRIEKPRFKQPRWVTNPTSTNFWDLFKKELLTFKKEKYLPKMQDFDDIKSISSDDGDDDEYEIDNKSALDSKFLSSNISDHKSFVEGVNSNDYSDNDLNEKEIGKKLSETNISNILSFQQSTSIDLNECDSDVSSVNMSESEMSRYDISLRNNATSNEVFFVEDRTNEKEEETEKKGSYEDVLISNQVEKEHVLSRSKNTNSSSSDINESDDGDSSKYRESPIKSVEEKKFDRRHLRKKEKCKKRLNTIHNFLKPKDIERLEPILQTDWMSSDSEGEYDNGEYFLLTHPLSWRSEKFNRALRKIDKITSLEMSESERNLEMEKQIGTMTVREPPQNIPESNSWILRNS